MNEDTREKKKKSLSLSLSLCYHVCFFTVDRKVPLCLVVTASCHLNVNRVQGALFMTLSIEDN